MTVGRVYVRGNFAEGNFGDDALLDASIAMVRASGLEAVLVGPSTPYCGLSEELPSIAEINPSDAVAILFGGGTQFFTLPQFDSEALLRTPSLAARFLRAALEPGGFLKRLAARRHMRRIAAVPHAAVGLGIGHFAPEDVSNEAQVAGLLRRMTFLWVRDQTSLEFCARHDLTQAMAGPDLCFSQAMSQSLALDKCAQGPCGNGLGIILRSHPCLDAQFESQIREVVVARRTQGDRVELISLAPQADDMQRLARELDVTLINWEPKRETIADFTRKLASYEILLTARFHGAIFGILTGTPCVTIAIDDKLAGIARRHPDIGMLSVPPHAPATEYLSALAQTQARSEVMRAAMAEAVVVERALAAPIEKAFEDFLKSLTTSANRSGKG